VHVHPYLARPRSHADVCRARLVKATERALEIPSRIRNLINGLPRRGELLINNPAPLLFTGSAIEMESIFCHEEGSANLSITHARIMLARELKFSR